METKTDMRARTAAATPAPVADSSRQRKIEDLCRDFLDRDQDGYVRIRRTGRLGWESLIPAGGCYSDMLGDAAGGEDLIRRAYGMARDCITAMDTPCRVTLRLSDERNCTDSRVVYLATQVFDDGDLSAGQQADTFIGLAVHEGCHLKWTDFDRLAELRESAVVSRLVNILEDERIERLCGEAMPGYANFLKSAKYYMFDLYSRRKAEETAPGEELPAGVRLLNAVLALVRYPASLRQKDLEEFADTLWDVREVIRKFPDTTEDVLRAAREIYGIIRRFFEQESRKAQTESGPGNESETGGSSRQDPASECGDGAGERASGTESREREEPDGGDGGTDVSGHAGAEGNPAVEKALERLEEEASDMEEIAPGAQSGQEPLESGSMAECVRRDGALLAGVCEDAVTLGRTPHSVLYRAPEDREAYAESLARVRRYVPAVSKALRGRCEERRTVLQGMRSGLLDTSRLAEAYQGVQAVYLREGTVRCDTMAVCVLIDESGSMYGEKIRSARDLAVLLNEALGAIPAVDLYIYGHTCADRCRDSWREGNAVAELQVYRERGYAPRHALGSVTERCGNLDSYAIREAAARMLSMTRCSTNLMFVLTDGAPNERYEQLAATVREIEAKGFVIVAVCIEPGYDPSRLYSRHVLFTDMDRLAPDLGRMVGKAVLKNAVRRMV